MSLCSSLRDNIVQRYVLLGRWETESVKKRKDKDPKQFSDATRSHQFEPKTAAIRMTNVALQIDSPRLFQRRHTVSEGKHESPRNFFCHPWRHGRPVRWEGALVTIDYRT
jgi:hypothetical protein